MHQMRPCDDLSRYSPLTAATVALLFGIGTLNDAIKASAGGYMTKFGSMLVATDRHGSTVEERIAQAQERLCF